jgi:hypothetical protein
MESGSSDYFESVLGWMLRRGDALGMHCAGEDVGLLQKSELWGVLLHFGELLIAINCSLLQ